MNEQVLLIGGLCAAFIAFIGAVTLIMKGLRAAIEMRDEVRDFLLDWRGRPGRNGAPGQSSVMERLGAFEVNQSTTMRRLDGIEQQLKPNGGQSMYDKVTQVRDQVVPSQRQGN